MKQKLRDRGFELVNDTPLPVACFTHERIRSGELTPETILERIYERGVTWISRAVMPDGSTALRTCITSYKSEETTRRRHARRDQPRHGVGVKLRFFLLLIRNEKSVN